MLRKHKIQWLDYQNSQKNRKDIYDKFEEFLFVLVWRETLFIGHGAPYTIATLMRF